MASAKSIDTSNAISYNDLASIISEFDHLKAIVESLKAKLPKTHSFITDIELKGVVRLWCHCATRKECEKTYGHISQWDVSRVENMSYLFDGQYEFNDDITNWNVSQVKNMKCMFRGAKSFSYSLSKWNISKETNTECMFCYTTNHETGLRVNPNGNDGSYPYGCRRCFEL